MTHYVFGNETDVILPSDSLVFESASLPDARYLSEFSRASVQSSFTYPSGLVDAGANLTTCWFAGLEAGNFGAVAASLIELYDSAMTCVFKITAIAADAGWESMSLQMYYLSSSGTFTAIGSPYILPQPSLNRYDVKVVPGSGGSAVLHVGGTARVTASADMTFFSSIRYARTKGGGTNWWSGAQLSDEPTVGLSVKTCVATADGATTDGVGSYGNINEVVSSDAAYNTFASANQVRLYDISDDLTGYDIIAVMPAARAKCGATGPQNIQLALRSGGTTYFSATKALNSGYSNVAAVWETDPNGNIPWTAAAVAALQFGTKSIT